MHQGGIRSSPLPAIRPPPFCRCCASAWRAVAESDHGQPARGVDLASATGSLRLAVGWRWPRRRPPTSSGRPGSDWHSVATVQPRSERGGRTCCRPEGSARREGCHLAQASCAPLPAPGAGRVGALGSTSRTNRPAWTCFVAALPRSVRLQRPEREAIAERVTATGNIPSREGRAPQDRRDSP